MKRLLFLVVAILLMATASLRAQKVYDPDGPWWNTVDSLVIISLAINSVSDDYGPNLLDGILVFNSDRNRDGDEAVLSPNQNIYRTTDSTWSDSEKGYFFNSDDNTSVVGTNGTVLYTFKSFNNGDIYISHKDENGKWTNPKPMKPPVNSPGNEQSIACENGFLIISSDRDGGLGEHDIYWARISFEGNFSKLQPFLFNTSADEVDVTLSPDGKTLYFSSDRNGGQYDIFASEFKNGTWQEPIRLPEPINSQSDDGGFNDQDTMFLMDSDRSGNFDIYQGYTYPLKTSISMYLALTAADTAGKMSQDTTFFIYKGRLVMNISFASADSSKKISTDTSFTVYKNKDRFDKIEEYIDSSGIVEYYAMVQVGAFYGFTVQKFRSFYPSLKNTPIIIKEEPNGKGGMIQKFLVDKRFTTIKDAEACQREMVDQHKIKDAFVAIYNVKNERIAIFNTYDGKFILLSDRVPVYF